MELCVRQLRRCTQRENCAANAIEYRDQLRDFFGVVPDQRVT